MGYVVKFVSDDRLPERVHWALLWGAGGDFYFVVKRSKVSPLVLAEGWAAYRLAVGMWAPRPRLLAAL